MRKLKLQMQVTIDGFVAGPKGEMDWMKFPWTKDIEQYVAALTETVDTIILGRKLAAGFIPHWTNVAADLKNPENKAGMIFTQTHKVIFTKTLEKSEWANTTLAKGNLVEEINNLKKTVGKDIITYGGGSFVSALLQKELIDELHLFINPVAIGRGMTIFSDLGTYQHFYLAKSQVFDCGIVVLNYLLK
jgi:dihydrofolate reductase